jgi:hypothetical protein
LQESEAVSVERNLVMVRTEQLQSREEFEAIASLVEERAPDIEVFIVNNSARNSVLRRWAERLPLLVFSPVPLRKFAPRRGKLYAGVNYRKMNEVERLTAAGIRVPECTILGPDTRLDPATWGPFTVLKPSRGMGGNGVRLTRTRDVRWVDPQTLPADDPLRIPQIAQRFVDTGPHTVCHKVTVFFGRPIWSTTSRQVAARTLVLDPDGAEPFEYPIAANHGERTVTLNYDPEILAFGASTAAAFPDVPVLGVDVIRDAETGLLYALEVNAGGLTWHTSSNLGIVLQRDRKIDLVTQFGAREIVADALIERTRAEAV